MSRRFVVPALVLTLLFPALFSAAQVRAAEDVLKLVPDSALGFVVFNRLDAVDAKLQRLGREMQFPVPSLLALLKAKGGIREGIDEKGTAAVLVLPPGRGGSQPTPVVLAPVTDYGRFLAQFKPEETGRGVARIGLCGTQFWVREIGGYAALVDASAVLTDASHREDLEKPWAIASEVPKTLAPWEAWLAEKDVAGVVLQPGHKLVSAEMQVGNATMKLEKEVSSIGFGARLDKQGVLHVAALARLVPNGSLARFAARLKPATENPLTGLPVGPFWVAAGGSFPEGIWDPPREVSLDLVKAIFGLCNLSEKRIGEMPKAALKLAKRVRSMSMVLGVGPSGASLYSGIVSIMRVDKSDAFLAEYEIALKQLGEITAKADNTFVAPMEVERSEIAGAPALQITIRAPMLPGADEFPLALFRHSYDWITNAFLGPGGKLVAWVVPVDKHTVVMGYVNKDHLQRTIQAIKQRKPGLAGDADVAKTAALLPAGAPWVAVWSLQGQYDLVIKQLLLGFFPDSDKAQIKIPEFPKTPPIGLAMTTAPNDLEGHLVVPAEVFKAIGQYVTKVKPKGEARGGKEGEKTYVVRGRVELNGKRLSGPARIRFVADKEADSKAFPVKDGKFEGRLKPGQYRVTFDAACVPERVRTPETSGLVFSVKEGANVVDFDLTEREMLEMPDPRGC